MGSGVTKYLLDVQPGLAKVIASTENSLTTRYVHDPITNGIHAQQNPDGSWSWMANDALNSVRSIYDDALNEVYTAEYAPYGVIWDSSGTDVLPYKFTGEMRDANGLQYHRARYLDLGLGAFISQDVLETRNRYSYTIGDPINYTDHSGLYCIFGRLDNGRCRGHGVTDAVTNAPGNIQSSLEVADFDWAVSSVAHAPITLLGGEEAISNAGTSATNSLAGFADRVGFISADESRQRMANLLIPVAEFWNDNAIDSELSQLIREHPTESLIAGIGLAAGIWAIGTIASSSAAIGAASYVGGRFISGSYNTSNSSELLGRLTLDTAVGGTFGHLFSYSSIYPNSLGTSSTVLKNMIHRATGTAAINALQGISSRAIDQILFNEETGGILNPRLLRNDLIIGAFASITVDTNAIAIGSLAGSPIGSNEFARAIEQQAVQRRGGMVVTGNIPGTQADIVIRSLPYQLYMVLVGTNIAVPIAEAINATPQGGDINIAVIGLLSRDAELLTCSN